MRSEDLKSNFKRTVRLDLAGDGSASLSKHFHAPGLGRLRDGWRARSEASALREAARRGLPVPEVLALERNGPSWILRLRWIQGARPLGDHLAALKGLRELATERSAPQTVAGPTATGQAEAQPAELTAPEFTPAESSATESSATESSATESSATESSATESSAAAAAPVGARAPGPCPISAPALARSVGRLLAIVEAAGLRYPDPHPHNVLVDGEGALWLVDLARTRFAPHTPASFERTLILACARLRDLSTPAFRALVFRAYLGARPALHRAPDPLEIERRATIRQRRDVNRRVNVWRRNSSATIVERDPEQVVRARHVGDGPAAGWRTERVNCSRREADAIWAHLVRAELHRLPSARPRRLALAPPYFVEFDVPVASDAVLGSAARAALEARLADRGLELVGSPLSTDGGVAIIPPLGHLRNKRLPS